MTTAQVSFDDEFVSTLAERVGQELGWAPRYVSKEKLCEHMGVSSRLVKTWRTQGLPALKVGKTLIFDLDDVRRWLESR